MVSPLLNDSNHSNKDMNKSSSTTSLQLQVIQELSFLDGAPPCSNSPLTATTTSTSTTRSSTGSEKQHGKDYYMQGSQELATETYLTLERLEARRKLTKNSERLVLVLVGLPARGKSFLSRKLQGFLKWHGVPCKVFNVGKYRRQAQLEYTDGESMADADFFDATNQKAAAIREKAAEMALVDMLAWLDQDASDLEEEDDDNDMDETHHNHTDNTSFKDRVKASINPEGFMSERNTRHDVLGEHQLGSLRHMNIGGGRGDTVSSREQHKRERIAIFDATNSTHARRQWILEQCTSPALRPGKPTGCVFLESICDDQELIQENFKDKVTNSPDYAGMPLAEAMADIQKRVEKYEAAYETISDDKLSYIKIYNLSNKVLVNHIYGRMSKIILPALMAWNIGTRPIFLCRPGQTCTQITTDGEDYVNEIKMGDSTHHKVLDMSRRTKTQFLRGYNLGRAGESFSEALYGFVKQEGTLFKERRASIMDLKPTGTSKTGIAPPKMEGFQDAFPLQIYTSTMPRAQETVRWDKYFTYEVDMDELSNLNPLDKGDFAGKELEEIQKINPTFYQKLQQDPFYTRFPGGESYSDLTRRLESVIVDLEQQVTPTLVVSHVSVLQLLIAYFRNSPVEKCTEIEIPLHTVIKFTPARGGGWSESFHPLDNLTSADSNHSLNNDSSDEPSWVTTKAMPADTDDHKITADVAPPPPPPSKKKHGIFSNILKPFRGSETVVESHEDSLDSRVYRGQPVA